MASSQQRDWHTSKRMKSLLALHVETVTLCTANWMLTGFTVVEKIFGHFKTKNWVSIWESNPNSGYLSQGPNTLFRRDTCTLMFMIVLQKLMSKTRYWIMTLFYTMELSSARLPDKIMQNAAMFMKLECISQPEGE